MIYMELCQNDFVKGFDDYGRSNNFSVEAREWLFDYYNDLSYDKDIAYDPVSICCEWSEYDTFADMVYDYGYAIDLEKDAPETEENIKLLEEYIESESQYVRLENNKHWLVAVF